MKRAANFIFLFFFVFSTYSYAQSVDYNQLISKFNNLKSLPDSFSKIDSIIDLAQKLKYRDYEKANEMLDYALALSWDMAYTEGLGKIYNIKGQIERKKSNFTESIKFHKRALNFLEKSKDTLLIIKNLNNLANSLRKINMEEESLKYFQKALHLANKINHQPSIAISLHGIGNIYSDIENFKDAIPYFYKSLNIETKRNNKIGIEYSYANLAEAYTMLKKKDSAKYYLDKTLNLAKQLYGKNNAIEYNLLGKYYYVFQQYRKAIEAYKTSLEMLKNTNIKRYMANGYIMLGKSYFKLGNLNQALQFIHKGIGIAEEINSKENIVLGLNALIDIALQKKDYKTAYHLKSKMEQYEDSILNLRIQQNMDILNVLYETREKDEKIKQLAVEKEKARKKSEANYKILILVSIISLLIIGLLLTILHFRNKATDIKLEAKNKEIKQYLEQLQLLKLKELSSTPKEETQAEKGIFSDEHAIRNSNIFCRQFVDEYDLTQREYDVLKLICEGLSNEEIAKKLYISKNTVKTHIRNIYEKLNVTNRREIFKKLYNINLT